MQSIEIGNQTVKGIKLVELFAESMTQFIFTCYIMAEFGLDLENKGWIKLFSVIISYISLIHGFSEIGATNMGSWPFKMKNYLLGALFKIIDVTFILSISTVLVILYGLWIPFGILAIIWPLEALFQWKYLDHKGKIISAITR